MPISRFTLQSLVAATLLGLCSIASAEVFDASLSQDTVRIAVNGPLSRLFAVDKGEYSLGVVGGEIDDFPSDNFFSLHGGVMLTGEAAPNLEAGLGARLQYVDADSADGGSLALGGQLRLKLLQADRLRFNAGAWYGPKASTSGDFDEFTELSASVGYEVLRDAELYVGYRSIEVGIDNGPSVDLEDGAHVGIRLQF